MKKIIYFILPRLAILLLALSFVTCLANAYELDPNYVHLTVVVEKSIYECMKEGSTIAITAFICLIVTSISQLINFITARLYIRIKYRSYFVLFLFLLSLLTAFMFLSINKDYENTKLGAGSLVSGILLLVVSAINFYYSIVLRIIVRIKIRKISSSGSIYTSSSSKKVVDD